jgi:hypothetical protein
MLKMKKMILDLEKITIGKLGFGVKQMHPFSLHRRWLLLLEDITANYSSGGGPRQWWRVWLSSV